MTKQRYTPRQRARVIDRGAEALDLKAPPQKPRINRSGRVPVSTVTPNLNRWEQPEVKRQIKALLTSPKPTNRYGAQALIKALLEESDEHWMDAEDEKPHIPRLRRYGPPPKYGSRSPYRRA